MTGAEASAVMVDTSVWIDALRRSASPVSVALRSLLVADRARTCGPVVFEIQRGLRPKERSLVLPLLEAVRRVPFGDEDFSRAAALDSRLRSGGETLPAMDLLIAAACLHHGLPLMTLDRHFDRVPDLVLV
jgi:predicted nucleic acid-binding protein